MSVNVPDGGMIGRLNSRQTGSRRELYEPKLSSLKIAAGNQSDVVFFASRNGIDRISNIRQAGVLSVHEGFWLQRMGFHPWYGTSERDWIAIAREAMVVLQVMKDQAYKIPLYNMAAGTGWFSGSLPNLGLPSPFDASDLGDVPIGPGETFETRMVFFRPNQTGRATVWTCNLEGEIDEPA